MDKKKGYKRVEKIAREFARNLSRSIPVERAVLFGSWAKGTAGKDSDIDLVFISPEFEGVDGLERFRIIGNARDNYEFAMDYFGLTPEEYKNASPLTTIGEVKETGKVVYP